MNFLRKIKNLITSVPEYFANNDTRRAFNDTAKVANNNKDIITQSHVDHAQKLVESTIEVQKKVERRCLTKSEDWITFFYENQLVIHEQKLYIVEECVGPDKITIKRGTERKLIEKQFKLIYPLPYSIGSGVIFTAENKNDSWGVITGISEEITFIIKRFAKYDNTEQAFKFCQDEGGLVHSTKYVQRPQKCCLCNRDETSTLQEKEYFGEIDQHVKQILITEKILNHNNFTDAVAFYVSRKQADLEDHKYYAEIKSVIYGAKQKKFEKKTFTAYLSDSGGPLSWRYFVIDKDSPKVRYYKGEDYVVSNCLNPWLQMILDLADDDGEDYSFIFKKNELSPIKKRLDKTPTHTRFVPFFDILNALFKHTRSFNKKDTINFRLYVLLLSHEQTILNYEKSNLTGSTPNNTYMRENLKIFKLLTDKLKEKGLLNPNPNPNSDPDACQNLCNYLRDAEVIEKCRPLNEFCNKKMPRG